VRKGNKKVLRDVNEGLRKVIKSGAYARVYAKWFGANTPVPKLPVP
jgi:polar amino acid transport system substrate-binding protein